MEMVSDMASFDQMEAYHREHVHLVCLKDSLELVITQDPALVVGLLQVMLLDMCPDALDRLRSGKLCEENQYNICHQNERTYCIHAKQIFQRLR